MPVHTHSDVICAPRLKSRHHGRHTSFFFSETIVAPGWLGLASDGEEGHGLPGRACVDLSEASACKTVLNPVGRALITEAVVRILLEAHLVHPWWPVLRRFHLPLGHRTKELACLTQHSEINRSSGKAGDQPAP